MVVLGDEDAERPIRLVSDCGRGLICPDRSIDGFRNAGRTADGEPEGRTLAQCGFDADLAAEKPCELLADRQTEPGPAILPRRRPVG